MADDGYKVRVLERLKIKIGEAKNLQARTHGSSSQRDVYCTLSLDQEEIFRTSTIEKSLSPFFGEEFQFEVPRNFRFVSVYVFDRDRHLKQDKVLGKVAIKREDLASYNNKDHWFPIKAVDADSEVQGKANIEIKFEPAPSSKSTNNFSSNRQLSVRVLECFDLPLKCGSCEPYAIITVLYTNGKKNNKRTKVQKKTTCPQFEEVFTFDSVDDREKDRDSYTVCPESEVEICELQVAIWHNAPGMGGDVFLGEVRIQLRGMQQQNAAHRNAWYFLQPRSTRNRPSFLNSTPPGTRLSCDNSLGSLRLQVQYTEDKVFPAQIYEPLRRLLLQSVHTTPITSSAVYILGEVISSKMDIAQPLVKIFMHHNEIVSIIRMLANHEVSGLTDATTIFRGNTLVSKMMDEAMRLIGLRYLHKTLRPTLDLIFAEKKPCEIDPTRIKDANTIQANLANLKCYVQKILDAITQSAVHCPALMCQIFYNLRECALLHFPANREVKYSVISGFIFLRFFAPAILGPRLFDLTTQQIDSQTNRTLTLISKTIQSLGNYVSSRSTQQVCKEEYMERLYKIVYTEKHIMAVRQFLEIISAISNPETIQNDTPVLLKEGQWKSNKLLKKPHYPSLSNNHLYYYNRFSHAAIHSEIKRLMIKRAQGRKRFGRKNFKQRYFKLTTHDLSYSKNRHKEALCQIPLSNILAVERLNERSFKMKNMFQIIQRERALYVQASNCVEEKEWIDLLTKICQTNSNRLKEYHPCAFINGQWQCCKSQNELAPGCNAVSTIDNNLHMSLDPERDLQRIHSLIMGHLEFIESFINWCEGDRVYSDPLPTSISGVDLQSWYNILREIREIAYQIERRHRIYNRTLARDTRYGSKAAPIGDDNYLLASRMNLDIRKCGVSDQDDVLLLRP